MPDCHLVLEDGTVLPGQPFGAAADAVFELVFNTSMTGYQEILTDPSYRGQGVLFTVSHIGNVGINPNDYESAAPQVSAVVVREEVVARNLATYGVFAATERLLMEAVKAGGDRQELHEVIREHSLAAWDSLRRGEPNPLVENLCGDQRILCWLPVEEVTALFGAGDYVGDAVERARALAEEIRRVVA